MVYFNIISNPSGAKVYIDNGLIGTTPVSNYSISPGTYNVRIEKDAYVSYQKLNFYISSSDLVKTLNVNLSADDIIIEPADDREEDEPDEEEETTPEESITEPVPTIDLRNQVPIFDEKTARQKAIENYPELTKILETGIVIESAIIGVLAIGGLVGASVLAGLKAVAATGVGAVTLSVVLSSTAAGVAKSILGAQMITLWLASDNVLTGTSFTLKKIREAMKTGIIDLEEAMKQVDRVQEWVTHASGLVYAIVTTNPLALAFRPIYLINAEKAQVDLEMERNMIIAEGGQEDYLRGSIDNEALVSRQVAYKEIFLPNRETYQLPFEEYQVHHINEKKRDNTVENLKIVTPAEHSAIHGFEVTGDD